LYSLSARLSASFTLLMAQSKKSLLGVTAKRPQASFSCESGLVSIKTVAVNVFMVQGVERKYVLRLRSAPGGRHPKEMPSTGYRNRAGRANAAGLLRANERVHRGRYRASKIGSYRGYHRTARPQDS